MSYDQKEFLEALEAFEAEKNISKEVILDALKEAMEKSYRKELGGDDADVHVDIDPESGAIEMYQLKVVKDEVLDDFLEISVEDANKEAKKKQKYKDGDLFRIDASLEKIKKTSVNAIRNVLRQKIAEVEKANLYNEFKDKIGTIITGTVEKVDDRGLMVDIMKTNVFLPRKEMIGDEKFVQNDKIKIYVKEVGVSSKLGAHIVVTRANDGFLKCLFFEQIHEVYDGTIEIKGIARRAGVRSKVAVYSNDPNVEPTSACIGQGGARIQKIVGQLGNGSVKEKIDVINYSNYTPLFILDAMKPAIVKGIHIDSEEERKATVIVSDDTFNVAIGRGGVNVMLAGRLTSYKLEVMTESEALENNVEYQSYEEVRENSIRFEAEQIQIEEQFKDSALPGFDTNYVAPDQRKYEDEESSELDEALNLEVEKDEERIVKATKEEVPVKVEEEKPAEEKKEVTPKTEVKVSRTLEDLEKAIDEDANKKKSQANKKKSSKKKVEEEEETKTVSDPSTYLNIYTEEELRELDEEEQNQEEDIDFYDEEYDEEYDDDKYY